MNTLGHLYFARYELVEPFYTLGLIYPGMTRRYRKESYGNRRLKQGIDEHIQANIKIHSQQWFKDYCRNLAESHTELNMRFKSHLYHWALEIAIDYNLNKEHDLDDLISTAEHNFNDNSLIQFLSRNNNEVLNRLYRMLRQDIMRSLENYEGCIQALKRIHDHVTMRFNLKSNAEEHFHTILNRSDVAIRKHMENIYSLYRY